MARTQVTIRVRNRKEAEQRVNDIISKLRSPKGGLERATENVAKEWAKNFDEEGSRVGGWADLAEMTQNMREYQGFAPAHPILIRYGALRAVAVDFFERGREGQRSEGDNYSDEVVKGRLSINRNTAELEIGGSYKVANQYGFLTKTGQFVPARPFWFVDRGVSAAARTGIRDWIVYEVLN